jgi:hypothetical protein
MIKRSFRKVLSGLLVTSVFFSSMILPPQMAHAAAGPFNTEVIIEAEDGTLGGDMTIYSDDSGAAGSYISSKNNPSPAPTPTGAAVPDALFAMSILSASSYAVWARVYAADSGSDSYYFAYNNTNYVNKAIVSVKPEWQWIKVDTLQFDQGTHQLKFKYRENNFRIDRLVVTKNLFYTPTGMGADVADSAIEEPIYPNPYNEPAIKPPANTHPRLFVRESDIPTIRQNLTKGELVNVWSRVQTTAAIPATGILNTPAAGQSNYDDSQRKIIEANALLYLIDGNETAGQRAVDIMHNYIGTVMIPKVGDSTRQMGQVIITAGMVYDWCYDLMDDEQRLAFRLNVNRIAQNMEIGYPPVGQGAVVGHGPEAQLLRDILGFSVAAYDENPNIYNITAGRFFDEFVPAKNFMYESGTFPQGDSYGPFRFQWDMFAAYIFNRMGAGHVFSEKQQDVAYQWIYARRPDGQLLRDGDSFKQNTTNLGAYWSTSPALFYAASYYNDPYLRSEFLREYAYNNSIVEDTWMVLFDNPEQSTASVSSLPPSKYFGAPMGSMIARTGWATGYNANTVVASMNIGNYNFVNHQHLDAGSFQLYYKGALAIDSGVYQGISGNFAGNHDANYNKRTIAHNAMLVYDPNETFLMYNRTTTNDGTPLVNDGGQKFPNNYMEPRTLTELVDPSNGYEVAKVLNQAIGTNQANPDFTYIKGDITKAYSSKVADYKRSMVFLDMKDTTYPGVMIVHDKLTSSDPAFKKTWLLHSINEPAITGNMQTITNGNGNYNGKLVNTTLLPALDNANIVKVGGEGNRYSVGGVNYPEPVASGNSDESGAWRIELSPQTPAATDEFLNVMQVMDNNDEIVPLQTDMVTGEKVVGAKIGDRVVTFGKESDLLSNSFQFEVSGEEASLYYLVTDLAPGYWTVEREGIAATEQYAVTEGNGSLYFKGAAGAYTLTRNAQQTLPLAPVVSDEDATVEEVIAITVDGVKFESTPAPKRINGIAMLPANNVMAGLGARVSEASTASTTTFTKLGKSVSLQVGSNAISVGGETKQLSQKALAVDGVVYVPADFIDLTGWGTVEWDDYLVSFQIKTIQPVDNNGLVAVTVNQGGTYSGEYTIDQNLSTYWSASGDNAVIMYDLGSAKPVNKIGIAWYKGDARKAAYEVQTSLDGENWEVMFDGMSSGTTSAMENTVFANSIARYVRIVGHGFMSPYGLIKHNAIAEVKIYSSVLSIVGVKSKGTETAGNESVKAIDGDPVSYWTSQGEDQWIQFDLGAAKNISGFGSAWYRGDVRQQIYKILISEDEQNWTTVFDGRSSGTTLNMETVYFPAVQGRYVRIVCDGNTSSTTVPNSGYNSLAEAIIYDIDTGAMIADNPASVNAITFKDESNQVITEIPANGIFKIQANVTGNVDHAKVKLIYALYNNDELLSIDKVEETLQKDETKDFSLAITVPERANDPVVKVFVWDELNRPLTNAVIFPGEAANLSDDATLSHIAINGQALEDFESEITSYTFNQASATPPVIAAIAAHNMATVQINQATAVPGTATIVVTAENGQTQKTYTVAIALTHQTSTDATLSDLRVNGTTIAGFAPGTTVYTLGNDAAYGLANAPIFKSGNPAITATAADANATVTIMNNGGNGASVIKVTAEDGVTTQTYKVNINYILKPVHDNVVDRNNPSTIANAAAEQIVTKKGISYVLQQFDLTGVNGTVSSAFLTQRVKPTAPSSSVVSANVYGAGDSLVWTEETVNFNLVSTPLDAALNTQALGQYDIPAASDWIALQLDVTSYVNQLIAAGATKVTFIIESKVAGADFLISTKEKGWGFVNLSLKTVPLNS